MKKLLMERKSSEVKSYDWRKPFSENVRRELRDSRVTGRKSLSSTLKKVRAMAKRLKACRRRRALPRVEDGDLVYEVRSPTVRSGVLYYVHGVPRWRDYCPDDDSPWMLQNHVEPVVWPSVSHYDRFHLALATRRPRQVFTAEHIDLVAGAVTKLRNGSERMGWVVRHRPATKIFSKVEVKEPRKVKSIFFTRSRWCAHRNDCLRVTMRSLGDPLTLSAETRPRRLVDKYVREVTYGFFSSSSSISHVEVDVPRSPFKVPSLDEWAKVNPFYAEHVDSIDQYYCATCCSSFDRAGHIKRVGGCTMHKQTCGANCLRQQWQHDRLAAKQAASSTRGISEKKLDRLVLSRD